MPAQGPPPPLLRLVGWAPQPFSSGGLPSLDPETLFVASVLQSSLAAPSRADAPRFSLVAPSGVLHSTVPCLEDVSAGPSTGIIVAAGSEAVRSLAARLRDVDEDQDETTETDDPVSHHPTLHAVEALACHRLAPLVAHALFLTPLYRQHTAHLYAAGLGSLARASVPRSLRTAVAAALEGTGVSGLGVGVDKLEEEKADRVEWEKKLESAEGYRAAAQGLSTNEKRETGRRFGELKFITQIAACLDQLSSLLGDDIFFAGTSSPSSADLRIFSLLAPLTLPAGQSEALLSSAVAKVVHRHPKLIALSRRIHQRLWAIPRPAWPVPPPPPAWTAASAAEALGSLAGRGYAGVRNAFSSPRGWFSSQTPAQPRVSPTPPGPAPPARPQDLQEGRQLRRGRWLWIGASVAGFIWTVFASGLISIEVLDEDEEDEDHGPSEGNILEDAAQQGPEAAPLHDHDALTDVSDDDHNVELDNVDEDDEDDDEDYADDNDDDGQGPWQEEYGFDLDELDGIVDDEDDDMDDDED